MFEIKYTEFAIGVFYNGKLIAERETESECQTVIKEKRMEIIQKLINH